MVWKGILRIMKKITVIESRNKKRTSEEWQKLFPETIVHDPDGWDRKNFQYSWYEELITFREYNRRLLQSTLMYKEGSELDRAFDEGFPVE
jgi:hypothetical protein